MFDSKPTTGYRFPRIHDLFLAFVPLKTQAPLLVECIESCITNLDDELLERGGFIYRAPEEDRVSPGLAIKQERAYLRAWHDPATTSEIYDRERTERRVSMAATALDYFHQANREWRELIDAVRDAIDEAATELDQGTQDLLARPSVQIRLALDDLSRAVPYDGLSNFDDPNFPDFDAVWIESLKELWTPVGRWMQRTRSIGHMYAPRAQRDEVQSKVGDRQPTGPERADKSGGSDGGKPLTLLPGSGPVAETPPSSSTIPAASQQQPIEESPSEKYDSSFKPTAGPAREQAPAQATGSPARTQAVLEQRNGYWHAKFGDQETQLRRSETGLRYLVFLIKHQGTSFSVQQLVSNNVISHHDLPTDDTDWESLDRVHTEKRKRRLEADIESASLGADERLQAKEELERIKAHEKSHGRCESPSKKAGSRQADNLRVAVQQACKRAFREIEESGLTLLAAHLRQYTTFGFNCTYARHAEPIDWEVSLWNPPKRDESALP